MWPVHSHRNAATLMSLPVKNAFSSVKELVFKHVREGTMAQVMTEACRKPHKSYVHARTAAQFLCRPLRL